MVHCASLAPPSALSSPPLHQVHGRNYTAEELEWGHVAPSAEAEGADWPVCCGGARAASCLGADSTCTAATFVSDGEVRGPKLHAGAHGR